VKNGRKKHFTPEHMGDKVLKNKYQAVSPGARRFGAQHITDEHLRERATPDHGLRRSFSTS
jgi:hypothetical protein